MKNGTLKPSVALMPQSILSSLKDDCHSMLPYPQLSFDMEYLCKRYSREGDAFVCVAMPLLGKALEVALSSGEKFSSPLGWPLKKGTKLPRVFYSYFKLLLEDDGSPCEPNENSAQALMCLRQVLMFWSRREADNLGDVDVELEEFLARVTRPRHELWADFPSDPNIRKSMVRAKALLLDVFGKHPNPDSALAKFVKEPWGRHGPGAVANKECAAEKWNFDVPPHLPKRLFVWGSEETVVRGNTHEFRFSRNPRFSAYSGAPSSRVTFVPKDFRGPRTICIEPKEFQFGQQGLMELIMRRVHSNPLTNRSINFFDVTRSRDMCFNTYFATIDLKEASDRISLELVKFLFPSWFYRLIVRYRTPMINDHRSTCFASMGSALCFPIQTLVFWALCRGALEVYEGKPIKKRNGLSLRVFGDDIIVPTWGAHPVIDVLTACKLKVNPEKTCIHSFVRESCGEWVYNNISCRISRPKVYKIETYADWSAVIDVAEDLNLRSFTHLALLLKSKAFEFYHPRERYGRNLQRPEIRVPTIVGGRSPQLGGYAGLYAWHTRSNTSPFLRGTRFRVKWGWSNLCEKFASIEGVTTPHVESET